MAAPAVSAWRQSKSRARARRAVIATAGSKAKRDLLTMLGVHHVLDSRSIAFVDEVRTITGTGVDVVLNSLAGEAMERSIGCLREFGRFVELGKRDYVSNTHIGLRPFRNNISYFGVDLEQLMADRNGTARKIYAELMRRFTSGALTPLPHSVFRACDLAEAFHLMQHSGHIGKIVVRPPATDFVRPPIPAVRRRRRRHACDHRGVRRVRIGGRQMAGRAGRTAPRPFRPARRGDRRGQSACSPISLPAACRFTPSPAMLPIGARWRGYSRISRRRCRRCRNPARRDGA